jgi:hypothetical protein
MMASSCSSAPFTAALPSSAISILVVLPSRVSSSVRTAISGEAGVAEAGESASLRRVI